MFQITRQKTLTDLSNTKLNAFRKQWQESHAIVIPQLLEPELLELVRKAIKRGEFCPLKHVGVDATEHTLKPDATITLLEAMTSEPTFCNVIEKITNSKPIGNFHGRVYNISKNDHDDWHQDAGFDYMMAMSINLSEKPYQGGSLVLRDVKTKKVLADIHNIGPGDALFFDISKSLEHKITPVSGRNPKIAFAGWFRPTPSYQAAMSKDLHKVMKKSRLLVKSEKIKYSEEDPFQLSESIAFRTIGKRSFIVNLKDDSQCVLNDMSSEIWQSLCNKESKEETLKKLKNKFEENYEELNFEYDEFVKELLHIGFLNNKQLIT